MEVEKFTRYDMFKMLIVNYDYHGNDDWLEMEKFLATIYNCNCTDCEGTDYSGPCLIEKAFSNQFEGLKYYNML